MSTSLEALEAEALKLSPEEREQLLETLVISLAADPEVERAWEELADRREAELDSGAVTAIPGEEAMAQLRAKHFP
ncbi:MAG TPA: addiction module protein [Burkholderiales bacterium]|jgi:putative addiction module component (TIGR02574 family)